MRLFKRLSLVLVLSLAIMGGAYADWGQVVMVDGDIDTAAFETSIDDSQSRGVVQTVKVRSKSSNGKQKDFKDEWVVEVMAENVILSNVKKRSFDKASLNEDSDWEDFKDFYEKAKEVIDYDEENGQFSIDRYEEEDEEANGRAFSYIISVTNTSASDIPADFVIEDLTKEAFRGELKKRNSNGGKDTDHKELGDLSIRWVKIDGKKQEIDHRTVKGQDVMIIHDVNPGDTFVMKLVDKIDKNIPAVSKWEETKSETISFTDCLGFAHEKEISWKETHRASNKFSWSYEMDLYAVPYNQY